MNETGAAQAVLACSLCGRALAQSDLVQIAGSWVCADCKPAFLSQMMASGTGLSPTARRYAGFSIRFGARFIDNLILMAPTMIGIVLFMMIYPQSQAGAPDNPLAALGFSVFFLVSFLLLGGCYEILMLKYKGATLGKMACRLKVIRSDGSSLSWGSCFARFFMWNVVTSSIPYLNFILMLTSSIMMEVDKEKRALHDRVCDTRVIYKENIA